MKIHSYLLLFFCMVMAGAGAQINTKIPDWVNVISVKNAGAVNKKQIKDGYQYLLIDEQCNTLKKQRYFHYATSAITEEALVDVAQIEFSYDPAYEKAVLHAITIYRGNEIINKIKPSLELKVLNEENQRGSGILNGKKTLYTNLSDVRKGDVVEYSYSIIGQNPVLGNYFNFDFWLSHSVPVGTLYARLIIPKNTELSITDLNTALKPSIKTTDVSDYVWEVNNPEVLTLESSTPAWFSPYARVQVSNLKSWNDVKEHCRLLVKTPPYNSDGLKRIMDSVVAATPDVEAQISFAVGFVQTHIRYSGNENGIYSHVPRTPDIILKNRFGDCKEKSVLLCEMLKYIHVKAYPVLINTTLGTRVTKQNPSIFAFDHCIASFIYENQMWFIDPTISYQRGSFKMRSIPDYKTGMVLDESATPFQQIPVRKDRKESVLEEFVILASGDAKLDVLTVFTGADADDIRYFFLTTSLYDIQESYKKFYNRYTDDIAVVDTVSYTDDEQKNEFTVHEHYVLHKFWVKDSAGVVGKDFIPYSLHFKLNYGEENKRKDPLQIRYPVNHTHTITVIKDGGWNVSETLKEENNDYFRYSYSYKVSDKKLSIFYDYSSKTDVIEPQHYEEYKKRMEVINYNILFSAHQNQLAEGTRGFNWPLLAALLGGLLLSAILLWYLYKHPYQAKYASQYDSIGGWLVLVGIGIVFNPISLLISVYNECKGEMGVNYAIFYFDETSSFFAPMKGYFTLFINFINMAMVAFSTFLAILFFRKKAAFRPYYALFRIFNIVFIVFDVIVLYGLYGDSSDPAERKLVSSETTEMIKTIFTACIWIPYVWYSERSRHTFTEGSNAIQSPSESSPATPESPADTGNLKPAE